MNTTSIILKTDKRGHVRTPPERREELLAEFDRSGLTLTRFAELAGVRYSTFATWLQQRRNRTGAAIQAREKVTPKPVRFAEVLVDGTLQPSAPAACALNVSLPGGAHLVLTEASQVPLVAQLIAALNPSCPC
jgi:transposase-like protein